MINLDDRKIIKNLDKSNMLKLLVDFPKQCKDALRLGPPLFVPQSYRRAYSNVAFLGLGGSAIGADLIKDYVTDKSEIPLFVNRDYDIPSFIGENTLVFASSYSGDTEETLSAYNKAKEKGASCIVITSGGRLKELAKKNQDIILVIPAGYPPRCALGYSFIPPLVSLSKFHIIPDVGSEIEEARKVLEELGKTSLWPEVRTDRNIAKGIAKKIFSKFPVVYASTRLGTVVTRWRGELAENAKSLSSSHVYPEMNHNEIVGWEHPRELLKRFVIIQLKDGKDHVRVRKRMEISEKILKKEGFEVLAVKSRGSGLLGRMLSLIYTGDFVSFYLAVLNGADPTPVDRVAYLKEELSKKA